MSTQVAYSFSAKVRDEVYDESGYLVNLTTAGGVSAQGKWEDSGAVGAMDCSNGGGTGTLSTAMNNAYSTMTGSVMMWVKANPGASGEQVLFHVGSSTGTTGDQLVLWAADSSGNLAWRWGANFHASTTTSILDGEWHFISMQAGGDLASGGLAIKVDGTAVYTDETWGTGATIEAGTFGVGQTVGGTLAFDGLIDDFRLLNDPIDSASLGTAETDFMNNEVVNQLEVQYSMDDGSGSFAHDSSGWVRDCGVSGMSWSTDGKHGGALVLADVTGDASVGLPDSPRWALMCWFKGTATGSNSVYSLVSILDASLNLRAELLVQDVGTSWNFFPRGYDTTGTQWASPTSPSFAADGDWHHLSFSIYPGGYLVTVDGEAAQSESSLPTMTFPNWDLLVIGHSRFAAPAGALIDDVRIISNYMYPEAVQRHMAAASAAPPASVQDAHVGDSETLTLYAGSASVSSLYVGDVQIYG